MADPAKRQRNILGLSLLALVVVAALAAGGFAVAVRLAARPGGPNLAAKQVLRLANVGGIPARALDPALFTSRNSEQVNALVYTGLVKLDANVQVIPDLASGWDISADGKTYTFHLRRGLRFSNGDPLTASDVAYSIDRAFSPSISTSLAASAGNYDLSDIVGEADRAAGKIPTMIGPGRGLVVTNQETLQIHLDRPIAFFLEQLTTSAGWVVDKKIIQQYGPDWPDGHAVGSGPFLLKSWQPRNQLITFVPNPYWYGPKTHLTEIDMPIFFGGNDAFQEFQSGAIDIDNAVDQADYTAAKALASKGVFNLSGSPALLLFFLEPNSAVPPFNNLSVRQAFAEAVDRNAIANQILGGTVLPSDQLVPQGNPGYDAGLQGLPFNPQDARARLLSVYPDPSLMPQVILSCFDFADVAAKLQQDFQTYLGVHIDLVPNCPGMINDLPIHKIQFTLSSWVVDYPDPADWLSTQVASGASSNDTNFENPQVDQLLAQADVERDQSKRFSLYHQAEELAVDDVALIPYAQGKNIVVFQKDVHGYALLPNGLTSPDLWANVYMCAGPC